MKEMREMNLILTSARLLLRPLEAGDADVEVAMGTGPEVMKYVGALESEPQIRRDMRKYVRRCAAGSGRIKEERRIWRTNVRQPS